MQVEKYNFLKVCDDITSKYNKIPKKEYIDEGEFPIVDLGK